MPIFCRGLICAVRLSMRPDEFHDGYPDSATPGLNNNAYTNIMAVWELSRRAVRDIMKDNGYAHLTTLDLKLKQITLIFSTSASVFSSAGMRR